MLNNNRYYNARINLGFNLSVLVKFSVVYLSINTAAE